MKKAALVMLIAIFCVLLTSPVFASGGKHHGEKGKGKVVQTQV